METTDFFESLVPVIDDFGHVARTHFYKKVPPDWFVIITDVVNSTSAIEAGRYKEVNAVGALSIMGVVNRLKSFSFPFMFGGDGATLCLPPDITTLIKPVLLANQHLARDSFDLDLRVGMVPVQEIMHAGFEVLVARLSLSGVFKQAVFSGGGVPFAETLVKNPERNDPFILKANGIEPAGDFSGLECRWNDIPSREGQILTLMVECRAATAAEQSEWYEQVIRHIELVYGDDAISRPVQQDTLGMTLNNRKLSVENKIRTWNRNGVEKITYWLRLRLMVMLGWFFMTFRIKTALTDWGTYKNDASANTDFKKFDDVIRVVLSGSEAKRLKLIAFLEELKTAGVIVYGYHSSQTALVTCLVADYNGNHIHFVDGNNGGYTEAARMLKKQKLERGKP